MGLETAVVYDSEAPSYIPKIMPKARLCNSSPHSRAFLWRLNMNGTFKNTTFIKTETFVIDAPARYDNIQLHDIAWHVQVSDEVYQWHVDHGVTVTDICLWQEAGVALNTVDQAGEAEFRWTYDRGFGFEDKSIATMFKLTFGGAA
jgi:hypothetical protein